ncbi:hypothetical protein JXA40_10520 [bacterium]|nr:hypothetical protein [candidate division CSSED10-310 bacterium]
MNNQRFRNMLSIDSVLILFFVSIGVEMIVPYVLDQLDFHNSLEYLPWLEPVLAPGSGDHPLAVLDNRFVPLKLLIRSISAGLALGYVFAGLSGRRNLIRALLLYLLIAVNILIPGMLLVAARISADNHALAHDGGVIQIEEAMKYLLEGRDPYHENYLGTPLENWRGFTNNIVHHLPYMPGSFAYSIPVYLLWKQAFGWYDQRIVHLLVFICSFFFMHRTIDRFSRRMTAMAVFAFNPLFTRMFFLGANDILILFLLLGSVYYLMSGRYRMGFAWLSLAGAIKQFAWFFVPFLVLFALVQPSRKFMGYRFRFIQAFWWFLPGTLIFLGTVLPFLFWHPVDFVRDTWLYGSGGLKTSYPIQGFHGFGFATFLLFFRWIPDGNVMFPFFWFQLLFCLPVLALFIRLQLRSNEMPSAILFSATLLGVFLYFSRYFNGNFLGFVLFWPVYAWAVSSNEPESGDGS